MARPVVYSDDDLVAELRRVAAQYPGKPVTATLVKSNSDVGASTFRRRFGDWRSALAAAGLEGRYTGTSVTAKMRVQRSRRLSDEEILIEMRRLADANGRVTLRVVGTSPLISRRVVQTRFGSWAAAVAAATDVDVRQGEDTLSPTPAIEPADRITYAEAKLITGRSDSYLLAQARTGHLTRMRGASISNFQTWLSRRECEHLALAQYRRHHRPPYWVTMTEAAELLGIGKESAYRARNRGHFPTFQAGNGDLLMRRIDINALLVVGWPATPESSTE